MANPSMSSPLRHSISFNSNTSSPTISPSNSQDEISKSPIISKDSILQESSKGWTTTPLRLNNKRTPLSPAGMSSSSLSRSHSSNNSLTGLGLPESHSAACSLAPSARKTSSSYTTLERSLVSNSPFVRNAADVVDNAKAGLPPARVSRLPGPHPQSSPVGLGLSESTTNSTPGSRNSRLPKPVGRGLTSTSVALNDSPTLPESPIVSKLMSPRRMTGPRDLGCSLNSSSSTIDAIHNSATQSIASSHSRSKSASGESVMLAEQSNDVSFGMGRPRSKTVTFAESEEVREFEVEEARRVSGSSVASMESSQSGTSDGSDATLDAYLSNQRHELSADHSSWPTSVGDTGFEMVMDTTHDPVKSDRQSERSMARQLPPLPPAQIPQTRMEIDDGHSTTPKIPPPSNHERNDMQEFHIRDDVEGEVTPAAPSVDIFGMNRLTLLPDIATSSPLLNFDSAIGAYLRQDPPITTASINTEPVSTHKPFFAPSSPPQRRHFREIFAERKAQRLGERASHSDLQDATTKADTDIVPKATEPIVATSKSFDSLKSPLEKLGAMSPDASLCFDTPDTSLILQSPPELHGEYGISLATPTLETLDLESERVKLASHQAALLEARKRARQTSEDEMPHSRSSRRRRSVSTSEVERSPLPNRMSQVVEEDDHKMLRPSSVDGLPRLKTSPTPRFTAQLDQSLVQIGQNTAEPFKTYRKVERRVEVTSISGVRDGNISKASGRKVRNVSDMNQHAETLKKFREENKDPLPPGLLFLKPSVITFSRSIMPHQASYLKMRLHNGSDTVESEKWKKMEVACTTNDEWALDQTPGLSFQMDVIIRPDPHLVDTLQEAQAQSLARKPSGGLKRLFGGGSPKKNAAAAQRPASTIIKPTDPLALYLNHQNVLAASRTIPFEALENSCLGKPYEAEIDLFDSSAGKQKLARVRVTLLYIPPLVGVPSDKLPLSTQEALKGLETLKRAQKSRHKGILNQLGGDCIGWHEREFRLEGSQLMATNVVTKKVVYVVDLSNALRVEDCNDGISNAILAASPTTTPAMAALQMNRQQSKATTIQSTIDFDERFDVERSFRIHFQDASFISFFTHTEQQKADWMKAIEQTINATDGLKPPLWASALETYWRKHKREAAEKEKIAKQNKEVPALPVIQEKPQDQPPVPPRSSSMQSLSESEMSESVSAPKLSAISASRSQEGMMARPKTAPDASQLRRRQ